MKANRINDAFIEDAQLNTDNSAIVAAAAKPGTPSATTRSLSAAATK